ncbi:MAG: MFS transporter [Anaerolineae bacterium]|nr:MFS transporter [Anaerolineae bacterium]
MTTQGIPRPWRSTFDALKNRHFRWYWIGMLASSSTMQMGSVGQGWLVYELTGSAFALGWVSAGWSISNSVLSPWGGVISDRVEKRALLLWVRGLMTLAALAITVLVAMDLVQIWHLAAYSLFRGVLFAVLMPAQNAYLAELVDRKTLLNAVSLNSVGMGLAGIFAAPLAGYLIDIIGIEAVYFSIAILYVAVFLAMLKLPLTGTTDPGTRSVWADIVDGAKYIRCNAVAIPLLGLVFARGFLAMPYQTMMPKYANDIMGLDASGLGILIAAPGVGSLISSLIMASRGDFRGKGKILLGSGIVMGLALVWFANTQVFLLVLILLSIVGATSNICMVTNRTLLQLTCDSSYLGRVMSAYMMMFGLTQLGTMPAGAIADRWGVPLVITTQGVLFALTLFLVWLTQPRLKELE